MSHREYCTGYWFDRVQDAPHMTRTLGYIREKAYFGIATEQGGLPGSLAPVTEGGVLRRFRQRNKLSLGDAAELLTPGRVSIPFTVTELYDGEGNPIESAPHPLMIFYTRLPVPAAEGDILRAGDAE